MKSTVAAAVVALSAMCFVGCASKHEEGVTSNYHKQWTSVNADTVATANAAKSVLNDRQLKNVTSSSTKVDGKATGKMSDGREVQVIIEKQGDMMSQVSVTVGTLGDPALGAEIAKAIKQQAEGGMGSMDMNMPTTRHSGM